MIKKSRFEPQRERRCAAFRAVRAIYGFTLMEMVITVVVLAIAASLAVPGLRSLVQNNRATAQANNFVTALQLARSEALKRAAQVVVCPSVDSQTCGGEWSRGWVVTDADDNLIQSWDGLRGNAEFDNSASLPAQITFQPNGRTNLDNRVTFELRLANCRHDSNRDIEIAPTGRAATFRRQCP